MVDQSIDKETDLYSLTITPEHYQERYCIIIEPVFYLSELFYDVYLWDAYEGEIYMHRTLDKWKEVLNHIKKIIKEYKL